jgi:hypothetical protein
MKTLLCAGLLAVAALSSQAASAHGSSCAKPFQYAGTVALNPGYGGAVGEFTVPAGYRLQIEYVSAGLRMGTNEGRAAFAIGTWAGQTFAWHPLPILTGYALSDRMASNEVSLYADAGTLVKVEINRASSTSVLVYGRYAVTGCLYSVLAPVVR